MGRLGEVRQFSRKNLSSLASYQKYYIINHVITLWLLILKLWRNSMPTYEFFCEKCGKEFSLIMSMKERETEKVKCSFCGADQVTQRLSTVITKTSSKS